MIGQERKQPSGTVLRPKRLAIVLFLAVATLFAVSCSDDGDGSAGEVAADAGDRERFNDEIDGVVAMVADCFVSEGTDGRRYRTTVEVRNTSDTAHDVSVAIAADGGRGGVNDPIEVPAGASDAWAVVSVEETTDPIGDVECADYITGVTVTLGP